MKFSNSCQSEPSADCLLAWIGGQGTDVRRKIADLRRLERTLANVAGRCRGGKVPDCPVIEALSDSRR